MRVRDAVEADAGRLSALADPPTDVLRNLIHDRTVRVAESEDPSGGDDATDADETRVRETDEVSTDSDAASGVDAGGGEILGFVSFDVRDQTVHITQIEGSAEACERLLAEPVAFARREGMDVELLVPETEPTPAEAAEAAGFRNAGSGPRFDGTPTTRYRFDPAEADGRAGGIRDR